MRSTFNVSPSRFSDKTKWPRRDYSKVEKDSDAIIQMVNSAPDPRVVRSKVERISHILRPGEDVDYLLKTPSIFDRKNSVTNRSISSKALDNEEILFITNKRLLFTQKARSVFFENDDSEVRAEHYPYDSISNISISTGGLIFTGSIEIQIEDDRIKSSPHKHINDERAGEITKYVNSTSRESPSWVNNRLGDVDSAPSMWCNASVEVEIIETYGLGLSNESCECTIDFRGIRFEQQTNLGVNDNNVMIPAEDIDFSEIKTSSRRDFEEENRSRYVNVINPVLESDSQTRKSEFDTIEVPLFDSSNYIIFKPSDSEEYNFILNTLSTVDARIENNTSSESEENQVPDDSSNDPVEILEKRLVKGEISPEEFQKRMELLED